MRTFLIFLAAASLFASGASAANSTARPPKAAPQHGMTQQQVLVRYGSPRHRAVVNGKEVWYYLVKFGEVYGREPVPFEFSSRNVNLGEIYFDAKNRIASFHWTTGHIGLILG